ncbi:tyrosine-protein phosphatase [Sphingobacterium multivorum]|uniref:tyrosine-protein phosphatase n=1 Tax=Sphingobacterium multivorum TaxID=28454 RepID=UPI002699676C|nr:CpsB/CapC family capsule biosynthesis tyrosine phosphatase [Sphingobacterium multivorum]
MWTIFNRKRRNHSLDWMHADMHSHILPGIDDGCKTMEESLDLLDQLAGLGLRRFHFTPHVFKEMYPNTPENIEQAYMQLKNKGLDEILGGYAAEYMLDSNFEKCLGKDEKDLLTLPDHHILIEMSYIQENNQIERLIFDLLIAGYNPILAHPERYTFYQKDIQKIKRLRDIGCLLQVNLLSLIGYYGSNERRVAKYLAEEGIIDLIGTDVHHERHVRALEQGVQGENLRRYFKKCELLNRELFASTVT